MERTRGRSKKIKWKKIGGGSFRMANGKIIKPNQEFYATLEEIPEGFRNVVVKPMEDLPQPKPLESVTTFELQAHKDGGYNVINAVTRKIMNEEPLEKEGAEKLLEELS